MSESELSHSSSKGGTPFGSLPQEVIELVIDQVKEEPEILSAFALVAHRWYQRTRDHLFREVYVDIARERSKDRCVQLKGILENRPSLRQCIKDFTLQEGSAIKVWNHWVYSASSCDSLVTLPPLLTAVETLVIGGFPDHLDWGALPSVVQIALYDWMEQPSVRTVMLIKIKSMDITPIAQYHHLTALHLEGVKSSPATQRGACFPLNSPSALPHPPSKKGGSGLLLFGVGECGEALETLIACATSQEATLDIFHPTRLSVTQRSYFGATTMTEGWPTVLGRCCSDVGLYHINQHGPGSIQDLTDTNTIFPESIFAFHRFPRLKLLIITFSYSGIRFDIQNPLPALLRALEQLSGSDTPVGLTKVELTVDFGFDGLPLDVFLRTFASDPIWARLDEILSRKGFPRLKRVIITFDVRSFRHALSKEEEAAVEQGLLVLMANLHGRRKMVEVNFIIPDGNLRG